MFLFELWYNNKDKLKWVQFKLKDKYQTGPYICLLTIKVNIFWNLKCCYLSTCSAKNTRSKIYIYEFSWSKCPSLILLFLPSQTAVCCKISIYTYSWLSLLLTIETKWNQCINYCRLQYFLDHETWVEEIPEERKCKSTKSREACSLLHEFMDRYERDQCMMKR